MLALKRKRMEHIGFTLIELMVVMSLLALITTLAAPSFQLMIARQKVSAAASELMSSALLARSEAIKNNRQVVVQPLVDTDWSRGWRIYVDMDNDKAYTETDTLVSTAAPMDESVTQNEVALNSAVGNLIGFDANGYLLGRNAGRIVFSSTLISASELRKGVKVSITGRARVCTSTTGDDGCAAAE